MNDCCESPMYQRLALLLSIGLVICVMACGLKGPPVPPQHAPIPGVSDLKGTVEGLTILLTWSRSGAGETQAISGYDIYSYRSDLAQSPCLGCPRQFARVGTLPISGQQASEGPFRFSFLATAGFRYLIKVRPYGKTGSHGPESNTAMVEFPKR